MKLYFYILDSNREYNPETQTLGDYIFKIRVEGCEVIEKPKTYRAVAQFPERLYIGYVKKKILEKFLVLQHRTLCWKNLIISS